MDSDKKISFIINLIAVFIMLLIVLTALFIYRDNIYDLLSKKKPDEPAENARDISGATSFLAYNSQEEEPSGNQELEPLPAVPEPDTDSENLANQTSLRDTEDSISSENTDSFEFTEDIENITENPEPEPPYSLQYMLDNAIEIPGTDDKIEPPPNGRNIETQYGAVPLSDTIPEPYEYFKNIVFLGDSVTSGFELFNTKIKFNDETVLEEVNVVAVGKYGVYYALQPISASSAHPKLNGEQTLPEDIIAEKDVKNVFICLGLNDLTFAQVSDFVKYYSRLIDRIKEKNPDKNIVIMSVTPLVANQQKYELNNDVIIEANNALLEFAKENNIYFIDYAAAIRDSRNCLPEDLSSDGYCHLTVPAYDMLVEYLLYHPIK